MSFITANQKIANRYQILDDGIQQGDLLVFSVKDTHTNTEMELITPTRTALLRPKAREHFLHIHRNIVPKKGTGQSEFVSEISGRPIAIRDRSLCPLQNQKQKTEVLHEMARWLIPTIKENAAVLSDGLHWEDIRITPQKTPQLQPAGIVNTHKLGQLDLCKGNGNTTEAALYGLGIILFELSSGTAPYKTNSPSELERLKQHPPRLSEQLEGIPAAFDELVFSLMSPTPEDRHIKALKPLDSPPQLNIVKPNPPRLQPSRKVGHSSKVISKPKNTFVIIAPAGLPDSLLRRAAAYGRLNLPEVMKTTEAFPITSYKTNEEALKHQSQLNELGISTSIEDTSAKGIPWVSFGLIGALAAALPVLGFFFANFIGLGIGAAIGIVMFFAALLIWGLRSNSNGSKSWQKLHKPTREEHRIQTSLFEASAGILHSNIPTLAKLDLLAGIERLHDIWTSEPSDHFSEMDILSIIGAAQQLEDTAKANTGNQNVQGQVKRIQEDSQFIKKALERDLE